jgi:hypothetical protein
MLFKIDNTEDTEEVNTTSAYNQALDFGYARPKQGKFDGFINRAKNK